MIDLSVSHFVTMLKTARSDHQRDVALHMALTAAMYSTTIPRIEVAQALFRLYYVDCWDPAATFFFFTTGYLLDKNATEDEDYTIEVCLEDEDIIELSTRSIMANCYKSGSILNHLFFEDEDEDGEETEFESEEEESEDEEEEDEAEDEEDEEDETPPLTASAEELHALQQQIDDYIRASRALEARRFHFAYPQ
jgi:hypothetical protein